MRKLNWLIGGAALLAVGSGAYGADLTNFDAYYSAAPFRSVNAAQRVPGLFVAHTDAQRGVPTFAWAARDGSVIPSAASQPEAAAWDYLKRYASVYGLSPQGLADVSVKRVHDTGRGGIMVVFEQRVDGVEVLFSGLKVLMDRELELVALGGNLHSDGVSGFSKHDRVFRFAEDEVIELALEDLYGVSIPAAALASQGDSRGEYVYFDLIDAQSVRTVGLSFTAPARAKPVYYPLPDRVVPAYYVELTSTLADQPLSDVYGFVFDAQSGDLLWRKNLTDKVAFNYGVYADIGGENRPYSGPHEDFAPHPTGNSDGSWPAFVDNNMISMEGFNTNPDGGSDPWLPSGETETIGNNVDAYSDQYMPDGYSANDFRATTTSSNTFNRPYDHTLSPLASEVQAMAAVTNAFYVTNWLHDYWYDSGFNEGAGNAQQNNFGRGGLGGDRMLVECEDSAQAGLRDNAFMSTPAEGAAPRMAMFIWNGPDERVLKISGFDQNVDSGYADFGPTEFDVTGQVALIDDGASPTTDGCSAIVNTAEIAGKIALIDRGTCNFQDKAIAGEAAGAIAVIIANNVADEGVINMAESDPSTEVTIPTFSISFEDAEILKGLLAAGAVDANMSRAIQPERDGALDGLVVCHEWGHYLNNRLNGGSCTSQQCAGQGEGWGDFVALHMQMREGDDPYGTYSDTQYVSALLGDAYFGIRRLPYSLDQSKNAFSFRHIQTGEPLPDLEFSNYWYPDNAESHNAGEIWATMLWESYLNMVGRTNGSSPDYSFDEARRRMSEYMVIGMGLAPKDATFTEQRDALVAAAMANDVVDAQLIAEGFATRGAGSCAISPPRDSTDLVGVVESFIVGPNIQVGNVTLDDSILSCDEDGVLDATETGRLIVEVSNDSMAAMEGTVISIVTGTPGVVFENGSSLTIDRVEGFSATNVVFEVSLDEFHTAISNLDLSIQIENPDACDPSLVVDQFIRINYDEVPNNSQTETVEAANLVWDEDVDAGSADTYSRIQASADNHLFYGVDPGELSDVRLVSPVMQGSSTGNLEITFEHRFEFEASPLEDGGEDVAWDGAVVEISGDGGLTWGDVGDIADAGYNGTVFPGGSNALAGRDAYVGNNAAWPDMETVTLNLGRGFNGREIFLRFRIGADEAIGAYGWEIDNISVSGIDNAPFTTLTADSPDETLYYLDSDGDGYGDPSVTTIGCPAPAGYVPNSDDCDDTDAATYPGAPEDGQDGIDHNCDGVVEDPGTGCSKALIPTHGSGLPSLFPLFSIGAFGLWLRRRSRRG